MPTVGSGQIDYAQVRNNYGGGYDNNSWRGRDGSWAWGAMYNSDSHYCRPRPWFEPAPGPERLVYWFYSDGWYQRFDPNVEPRGLTDYGLGTGTVRQYFVRTYNAYPDQFSGEWFNDNVIYVGYPGSGTKYIGIQAQNGVSGYRTTLGYVWVSTP